ncbi:succinylglutamate-semialdehyde dehydrogenase [Litorimonas sp. RW-G-Af-16]|uniref:succinylglutamate-semialdehyde dehydrogenase n=1 Tax=Litorimonas sp. RW-G-Af-16 TaxID=3241168 RepID=UPI00390C97F1
MADTYIDGQWGVGDGAGFESVDPATGESVWQGHEATAAQVDKAVSVARQAFGAWRLTSFDHRAEILTRYAEQLVARKEDIASAISSDMGKPIWEARTEAGAMAGKIGHSINAYQERTGHKAGDGFSLSHRPHGVMAVFGPFNFPGHLPNGHIVPSLLAGNTVVFKPSELTPQVAAIMVECLEVAGLPAGVLNLVHGGRETGGALLNAAIDGLLFTGSAKTGTAFHKHFGGRPEVILALEMGGNNPLIIREPASVEAAADIAFMSAFITSGQRCSCTRRLILPTGSFGDQIVEALVARIAKVTIGHGEDEVFMGPVVSAQSAEAAIKFETELIAAGGKPITELDRFDNAFLRPGLIDVTDAQTPDEELFGPLLQVIRADSLDAAFARANDTRFGLAGGLVCDSPAIWEAAQANMVAGILNWNKPTTGAASSLPFGGPGLSGNHRPSAYYAADYCAWPVASQTSPTAISPAMIGMT